MIQLVCFSNACLSTALSDEHSTSKAISAVVNEVVPSLKIIWEMNGTVRIDAFRDVLETILARLFFRFCSIDSLGKVLSETRPPPTRFKGNVCGISLLICTSASVELLTLNNLNR